MIEIKDAAVEVTTPEGGRRQILREVSLRVEPGELVVLVGRSGGGKTTVLNLVTGLVQPSSGTVTVGGREPRMARPDMGIMFARDCLLPWRTALGNVAYGMEVRGVARADRLDKAHELLALMGLRGHERKYPWQLSQGMRQRVALARTWGLRPKVLLLDEPFAAVDAQTRLALQEELTALIAEEPSMAVVFVTHDLQEAALLGDRIVVVDDGRVVDERRLTVPRPRDITAEESGRLIHETIAALRDRLV